MAELEHLGGKRAESARVRRAEQLRRWRGSQTQQEPAERQPRTRRGGPRVRFEDGAVFLAACSSGDTDEVKRLLARGADINTTNVDGLTALHQVTLAVPAGELRPRGAGAVVSAPACCAHLASARPRGPHLPGSVWTSPHLLGLSWLLGARAGRVPTISHLRSRWSARLGAVSLRAGQCRPTDALAHNSLFCVGPRSGISGPRRSESQVGGTKRTFRNHTSRLADL